MTALPDTTVTIEDGGLGLLAAAADGIHVKLGVGSNGTVNVLQEIADPSDAVTVFGYGPLSRALAHNLGSVTNGKAPRPIFGMRVLGSVAGTAGDVAKTAIGSSTTLVTVAGAAYDRYEVTVEILTTGILGAGTFRYRLHADDPWSAAITIPGGGTYVLPNTGLTLTFAAGTYDDGDLHAFTTRPPGYTTTDLANAVAALLADSREWDFVHVVGPPAPLATAVTSAGTSPPVVSVSGTPADYYDVVVEITTGGNRGTAVFRVSLDGGITWHVAGVTTAATYLIAGTGLTLAFATGTAYSTDNVYTFDTGNAAGLATLYGAVKTHMETAEAASRFVFALIEAPGAPDAALVAAMAAVANSPRVMRAAGFCEVSSPLDAKLEKRSAGWPYAARIAAIPISEDPSRRYYGATPAPVARVTAVYRTALAGVPETLYGAKASVLQTDLGLPGFYCTAARMQSADGSDFDEVPHRRVMDRACRVGRLGLKRFQADTLIVDATTGRITESEAKRVESVVLPLLEAAITGPRHASAVQVEVIRTDNLLSTKKLRAKVKVVPLGYAKSVEMIISFLNPALATA